MSDVRSTTAKVLLREGEARWFAFGTFSLLFWSMWIAELRMAASRMGEEAMAKVSGWRAVLRVSRKTLVRVRRLFSSWPDVSNILVMMWT